MERAIKSKRGFLEYDYFRPDAKNLLLGISFNSTPLFLIVITIFYSVLFLYWGVSLFVLVCLTMPFFARKLRLHELQVRYMESGVVPPQGSSTIGFNQSRYWDRIEQRHRYRDNGWQ